MGKKAVVRIILAAWVIIWAVFLIRPYFKKGLLSEYTSLIKLSTEEKRAHVTGAELYAFINFCKDSIKEPSTYEIAGIEKYSIEHRRMRYYLYPNIEKEDPEYVFVYKTKGFFRDKYKIFNRLDTQTYILRKTG
ncbi:MAG: hypothetical protein Q8R38_05580 [Candidatus Omnitrophota bacterium]|nr:hypothetical protein [Candidatus Omnitrophota bacterium]